MINNINLKILKMINSELNNIMHYILHNVGFFISEKSDILDDLYADTDGYFKYANFRQALLADDKDAIELKNSIFTQNELTLIYENKNNIYLGSMTNDIPLTIDDVYLSEVKLALYDIDFLVYDNNTDIPKLIHLFDMEYPQHTTHNNKYYFQKFPNKILVGNNTTSRELVIDLLNIRNNPLWIINMLIKWHIDIFDLVSRNLAKKILYSEPKTLKNVQV